MKIIGKLILCLCLLLYQPFSLLGVHVNNVLNPKQVEEETEEAVTEIAIEDETEIDTGRKITLNNTLDLDGYCTIMIPSEYYEVVQDQTTFTRKTIRYKDNRSKIVMSYVTNISRDADIPGYVVRETAGVDIVTNSKREEEYESGTWVVVPANDLVDNYKTTVYYIVSKDKKTVFWMRVNAYPDSVDEEFNEVLDKIINSYHMYYVGGTVFNTPDTGYYAETEVDGEGVIGDTTEYKANTEDYNVYQTNNRGFDLEADINSSWRSMEIIIDEHKIKLPCSMEDMYDAGFGINDLKVKSDTVKVFAGKTTEMTMSNSNGTNIQVTVINDSNMDNKEIAECSVVKLELDTASFLEIVDKPKEEDIEETKEADENNEYNPDKDKNKGKTEEEIAEEEESKKKEEEESKKKEEAKKKRKEEREKQAAEKAKEEGAETGETEADEQETKTEEQETETDYDDGDWDDDIVDEFQPHDIVDSDRVFDKVSGKHNVVLPGGLMMNIYTQDILEQYGTSAMTSEKVGSEIIYTWSQDNLTMKLRCGIVQNIKHIVLSTLKE